MLRRVQFSTARLAWSMIASGALTSCLVVAPPCQNCTDNPEAGVSSSGELGSTDATSEITVGMGGTDGGLSTLPTELSSASGITPDASAKSDEASGTSGDPSESSSASSSSVPADTNDEDSTAGEPTSQTTDGDGSASHTGALDASELTGETSSAGVSTGEPDTTEPSEEPMHEVLWTEGFEGGLAGWTVEGATWTVGSASNGSAPSPRGGSGFVGTGLAAPYLRENSRLVMPGFIVPAASREPYLRYWYWYSLEVGDTVQVQVRVGAEVNWTDLHAVTDTISTVAGHGNRWKQALLVLDQFAGQEIQLSFAMTSTGGNASVPGFFVDNVSLETGPMNICSCQGFNNGQVGDWSIEGGQWAVGAPEYAAAPDPYDNPNDPEDQNNNPGLAGTNMSGSYESLAGAPVARLTSPSYKVDNQWRIARFYYWHSFANTGSGRIQVRVMGERWQDVDGYEFTGVSDPSLTYRELPLASWAGETVQVGFLLENGAGVDTPTTPGFFIDEFFFQ